MLGWEFPPHITGGLGTACEGLTRALSKKGLEVHFLMPHLFGNEEASHLQLYDVNDPHTSANLKYSQKWKSAVQGRTEWLIENYPAFRTFKNTSFYPIQSPLSPYLRTIPGHTQVKLETLMELQARKKKLTASPDASPVLDFDDPELQFVPEHGHQGQSNSAHYGEQLFEEVDRYSTNALLTATQIQFDLIHAHDWMTYPAALLIAKLSHKPCILHVHSLESDRSGGFKNEHIAKIERESLLAAHAIIAVSQYTKDKLIEEYGIHGAKIMVVHNGLQERKRFKEARTPDGLYHVLFLGRVTFQKGPDYFVEAALKVLKLLPNTLFTLAGNGDMLDRLRARIQEAKAEKNFYMPGFLKGHDVDRAFAHSDLYVMPSVSEPFGISALEALYYNVPIVVSRQSGISEVIRHALKADFWDVDELANLIVGALKYPEMGRDLLHMAAQELKHLDWDAAATQVNEIYQSMGGA